MYYLIKPASGACNLRCKYCFYADEMQNRETAVRPFMTEAISHTLIDKALARAAALPAPARQLSFGFQGGEPMLAGLDFFRDFVAYARAKNTTGEPIAWFIQTNGTLLTREWAEFFKENGFLVGLSLDGVPELHNKNRVDPQGKGTQTQVLRAAELLKKTGVEFNILTVLTGELARSAKKVYSYYQKQGFVWQQYIPCISPLDAADTRWSLTAERYGEFLCNLFDLWFDDVAHERLTFNREFENWVGILAGREPEECGMAGVCSPQYLIEADGSVYPCDFYALDDYLLGNICVDSLAQLDEKRAQIGFIEASLAIPEECRQCKWYALCRGGCRRNRDAGGKNRFCAAYRKFFAYAYPRMQKLADMIVRKEKF